MTTEEKLQPRAELRRLLQKNCLLHPFIEITSVRGPKMQFSLRKLLFWAVPVLDPRSSRKQPEFHYVWAYLELRNAQIVQLADASALPMNYSLGCAVLDPCADVLASQPFFFKISLQAQGAISNNFLHYVPCARSQKSNAYAD